MWSKNKLKLVRALRQKKQRDAEGAFLAEGHKVVGDLAQRYACRLLAATPDYLAAHTLPAGLPAPDVVSDRELGQASALTTPHGVLAVFDKPAATPSVAPLPVAGALVLALDGVQDPGNLGTIIRLADWFGIERVVCSPDTADAFAPKVVQATMGALARVDVCYTPLPEWLAAAVAAGTAVYGTFMDGEDLYRAPLSGSGVIVMGNEGNGISSAVAAAVGHRLHIPSFPPGRPTVESLNVAMATAITLAEFRRRVAGPIFSPQSMPS